jgi:hypothetical protein
MTRQSFDALVKRIEAGYAGRQPALERAINHWIALGIVGLGAWLLMIIGVGLLLFGVGTIVAPPGGIVMMAVGVPIVLYGISQAIYLLRIERHSIDGHRLGEGEASALWSMLDDVRLDLKCRRFDEVRITLRMNAAVRELPRRWFFGQSHTILEIGLPLADAMDRGELKAIIAHECAHLSARHALGPSRIYRVNQAWSNLVQRMQSPSESSFTRFSRSAVQKFVDWYWARLHARYLVLSRIHEHQADCEAARIAGGATMARALWRLEGMTPWINERFWPGIFCRSAEDPEPPRDVMERMAAAIAAPPTLRDAALWTERGLIRATVPDETHPSLVDRVRPLGLTEDDFRRMGFAAPPQPSAAFELLGECLPIIQRELSEKWYEENLGPWRDRHRRARSEARRSAATANATAAAERAASTDVSSLWESAREAVTIQGLPSAVPHLRRVLDHEPNHDGASVVLGRHLAIEGDAEGEAMLAGVVERNDEIWMPHACEALQDVYRASGRMDLLKEIRARLDRFETELNASQLERSTVTARDLFVGHDLTPEALTPLLNLFAATPAVGAGWLVRKKLRFFPGRPLFVLCVTGTGKDGWSKPRTLEDAVIRRLVPKVELPGQTLVITSGGAFGSLANKVMKSAGSEVYRRG